MSILPAALIIVYLSFLVLFYLLYQRKISLLHGLVAILLLGLLLRIAAAQDPFLHTWDERFHALVAKNLAEQPLKPMLFTQPLSIS